VINFIADNFYYLFLGWIVLNLMQRKYRGRGDAKRTATLLQSLLIFILYIGAMVIRGEELDEKWIIIPLGVIAAALFFFRDRILPYRRTCRNCGAKLNLNQIFLFDANLCSDCDPEENPESGEEEDNTVHEEPTELPVDTDENDSARE